MKKFILTLSILIISVITLSHYRSTWLYTVLESVDHREKIIYITVMGNVPGGTVNEAKQEISRFYGLDVEVIDKTTLPKNAYCKIRKRYVAKSLLNHLKEKGIPGSHGKNYKVLALTNKDIETEDSKRHWGVMGLALLGDDQSIVSTFRMNNKKSRFNKIVLHEVGHMMAIEHCSSNDKRCFMKDAKGKGATVDRSQKYLCDGCKGSKVFF